MTYPVWQPGMKSFRGPAMQKGYGLGGLFKGLARSFALVLKRSLITAGKKDLKTGVEVLGDVARGEKVKDSVKKRAKQNVQEIFTINDARKKATISRKRAIRRKGSKTKKSRIDIFD